MKIVTLCVPHLPVQVERRQRHLKDGALIIGGRPWDPTVVLDCSEAARAAGIVPGMPLARAALRCPDARFLPAHHDAYQAVQGEIEAALRQFTDQIETAGLGAFFLEVGPLARRFPEDKTLAQALVTAVHAPTTLDVRVGLAEERFTAEQAARAARLNDAVVVPPQRGRTFLAPLPLNALSAEAEVVRRLALLGIRTLGQFAALPRAAVMRQFGAAAGFLHDLAAGADPRPVFPDAPPLELRHRMAFEPPAADRRTLHAVARRMAAALAAKLDKQGYQAQGLRIEITDETRVAYPTRQRSDEKMARRRSAIAGESDTGGGKPSTGLEKSNMGPGQSGAKSGGAAPRSHVHTTTTSVEPPTADEGRLARRIQVLVDRLRLEHPVTCLDLVVYPLRPTYLGATQLTLFAGPHDQRWQRLQEALRRLRARFGEFVVMIASLVAPPAPRPIEVRTGADRAPQMLILEEGVAGRSAPRSRRVYRVHRVYEHWRERRFWWAQPLERDYYRLLVGSENALRFTADAGDEDPAGELRLVYQDRSTGAWWLERRRM